MISPWCFCGFIFIHCDGYLVGFSNLETKLSGLRNSKLFVHWFLYLCFLLLKPCNIGAEFSRIVFKLFSLFLFCYFSSFSILYMFCENFPTSLLLRFVIYTTILLSSRSSFLIPWMFLFKCSVLFLFQSSVIFWW